MGNILQSTRDMFSGGSELELQGQVVLVTGASSGIGREVASQMHSRAMRVILAARSTEKLELLRDHLVNVGRPETFEPKILYLDLEDLKSLKSKAEEAMALFGQVDVIVHNAGMSVRGGALETEISVYSRLMRVNYLGCVELSSYLVPHMVSRGSGHVLVISSVQGLLPIPGRAAYCSSKHALQSWADCLRAELPRDTVKVSVISPSYVNTDLSRNALTASGELYGVLDSNQQRGYSVHYVAQNVINCLISGDRQVILAPLYVRLAVLLRAFLPNLYFYLIRRRAEREKKIL